jgi:hypothetical protein
MGKPARLFPIFRIVVEQLVIFFQGGSASSGVGYDSVVIAIEESVDILPSEFSSLLPKAGMNMKRAAATLACRNRNVASILLKYSYRGLVQPRKRHVSDATGKEGNSVPPLAFSGKHFPGL